MNAETVVAKQVREIRKRRGWTQADLAARLSEIDAGLSQPAVAKIETGGRNVSLSETLALAAALNVAPVHLFVPMSPKLSPGVAITPSLTAGSNNLRGWVRGEHPLTDADSASEFYAEVAEAEWYSLQPPIEAYVVNAPAPVPLETAERGGH